MKREITSTQAVFVETNLAYATERCDEALANLRSWPGLEQDDEDRATLESILTDVVQLVWAVRWEMGMDSPLRNSNDVKLALGLRDEGEGDTIADLERITRNGGRTDA